MVTRKDIARQANVSVSVVSRALNNSGYVAAEKREQILKIAEELGYNPNPVAMSLMRSRTKQILFCCKDMENAFNIELYLGMRDAADEQDYMVVVNGSFDFRNLKGIMTDGLIFPNEAIADYYLQTVGKNYYLPAVAATYGNRNNFSRSIPCVECDLWSGMGKVLDYLRKKGHRRIALAVPYDFENGDARIKAWKARMQDQFGERPEKYFFGISRIEMPDDPRILAFPEEQEQSREGYILIPENYFEKGILAADIFCERGCDATAVVCFNDEMALGFCKRMRSRGFRIPDDLSVMGVDGTYARKYGDQLLTTLAVNPRSQGRKCAEMLLDQINGRKFRHISSICTKILEGETVRKI